METGNNLRSIEPSEASEASSLLIQKEYQSLVGSLMYLMLSTRPDLAFMISTLSKYASAPTPEHLSAAKRVLRYLKETMDTALTYSSRHFETLLEGYSDSDWAGDRDDRKSTSGYVYTLGGTAISWKSKKQAVVALSSTEAEYIGTSEAAREAIWIWRLFDDLSQHLQQQQQQPQQLYVDNQGAIKLTENPRFHERTKHIDIKYHFVQEAHEKGLINVKYVPTEDMTADIMTKALPLERHWKHMEGMGLTS